MDRPLEDICIRLTLADDTILDLDEEKILKEIEQVVNKYGIKVIQHGKHKDIVVSGVAEFVHILRLFQKAEIDK